jgi:glycosyltransferase involved in cell wall biosynthesis
MNYSGLTALILTFNEEMHISRCLKSIASICDRIIVIDSFSTDHTAKIVQKFDCDLLEHKWNNNHAEQLNWGLDNAAIETDWVLRIDADEYLTSELAAEISAKLPGMSAGVSGVEFNRRNYFKGQWIRYGGYYPTVLLRIWRNGFGRCENRLMDEHIVLKKGTIDRFENDLVDDNLQQIHWWTNKHNNYALREAADLLNIRYKFVNSPGSQGYTTKQAGVKRFLKENVYSRMPLGFRPLLYFLFRFFIRLGFLDGPKGWVFHFLQGFWYRLLVDVNVWEAEEMIRKDGIAPVDIVTKRWKINIFKK